MSVTEKLLRVFRVDQQLMGLTGRLRAAERFLDEQVRQLRELQSSIATQQSQLKQVQAAVANEEGEVARIDARIATLREQMNKSKTNKEYQAFLVEVGTLKVTRDEAEQRALEQMTRADDLKAKLADLEARAAEREGVRTVASGDREKRAAEISGRVAELQAERAGLAPEIPGETMKLYEELQRVHGEDAMAPVEVADKRRHEATCGSCMMSVPVETVSTLMSGSRVVRCVSCGRILYIDKDTAAALAPASSKR
jgi:predicted  nucleic acid-binding Zn-ribbon protein